MPYTPAKVPDFSDLQQVGQFFQTELARVSEAFMETTELELRESFRPPNKPRNGMIVFPDGALWDPGAGRVPHYYDAGWLPFAEAPPPPYTNEEAQDAFAAAIAAGTHFGITFTYDDAGNSMSASVTGGAGYSDEEAVDAVAGALQSADGSVSFVYDDGLGLIDLSVNFPALTDLWVDTTGDTMTGGLGMPDGVLGTPSIFRAAGVATGIFFEANKVHVSPTALTDWEFSATQLTLTRTSGLSIILDSTNSFSGATFTAGTNTNTLQAFNTYKRNKAGGPVTINTICGGIISQGLSDTVGGGYKDVGDIEWVMTETGTVGPAAMGSRFRIRANSIGTIDNLIVLEGDRDTGLWVSGRNFIDGNALHMLRSTALGGALPGAAAKLAYFTNAGQDGSPVFHDGIRYKMISEGGYQVLATNAAFTHTPMISPSNLRHTGTLTANRIVTLANTNAYPGYTFTLTRTGGGAFTLDVQTAGAVALKSLATNTWGRFVHDGTDFYLAAYGAL